MHFITLPNGKRTTIATYVAAWRFLREADPGALIRGFDYFPAPASDVLRRMREGLTDRINKRGGLTIRESRAHPSLYGKARTPRVILYPQDVRDFSPAARNALAPRVYQMDEF